MKYCDKCKVKVNTPISRCPLCYATLSTVDNNPEPTTFPKLNTIEKYNILFRILVFLSLTTVLVSVTVNLLVTPNFLWSIVIIVNIIYFWVALGTALKKYNKIGYNILIQCISLAAFAFFLDNFFEHSGTWVMDYVIPFLFFSTSLSISIIAIIKHIHLRDFILYFILIALMGFVPIIFVLLDFMSVVWPSIVCALYSVLALFSIFIFADTATKIELKKRFHI